jgi:hypothetical protein
MHRYLVLILALVLGCLASTAEANGGLFSGRLVSRQKVVVRQQVVRQKVVQVQQVQAVYAAPVVQQVRVQRVVQQVVVPQAYYAPQAFRQQVVGDCYGNGAGVLQLNSGGCQALYAR